jgi:hypothetical protein
MNAGQKSPRKQTDMSKKHKQNTPQSRRLQRLFREAFSGKGGQAAGGGGERDSREAGDGRYPEARETAVIFKSELDFISRCILDCPSIETGGQLFGYYTSDGIPVVLYAIGPGRHANHQTTFFNQDIDYLKRIGARLKETLGLHHIGEWHSHHRLGLASPSGHDASTMIGTIREKGLGRFLLCIGNCSDDRTSLNPFPCDSRKYIAGRWDVIYAESPVRRPVDRLLGEELEVPRTPAARHRDASLSEATPEKPRYARGYWLEARENNLALKDILSYLARVNGAGTQTSVRMDEDSCVHIVSSGLTRQGRRWGEDILFPMGFPQRGPEVSRTFEGRPLPTDGARWRYNGDILRSFINYYSNI